LVFVIQKKLSLFSGDKRCNKGNAGKQIATIRDAIGKLQVSNNFLTDEDKRSFLELMKTLALFVELHLRM
jgi:hypothetical protein